jgi:competence protein ComEA
MHDAMPRWRSFTSAAAAPSADADDDSRGPAATDEARQPRVPLAPATLALLAAAIPGGAAGGAALALAGMLLMGTPAEGPSPQVAASWLADPSGVTALAADGSATQAGGRAAAPDIVVDVAGAVARPGVLRLQDGDRVADAIEAAGGYGPRVDLAATARSLNLAQPLVDGSKVLVPELGAQHMIAGAPSGDGLIDLNTADQAALESLPGIGPVTAGRIMAARDEQAFVTLEDLRERGLVGDAVFQDIRDLVRVGG